MTFSMASSRMSHEWVFASWRLRPREGGIFPQGKRQLVDKVRGVIGQIHQLGIIPETGHARRDDRFTDGEVFP